MFSSSTERVPEHTSGDVNERIRMETEANVECFASGGSEAITERLEELEREWDIERAIEANASVLSLIGLALGAKVDRRWFLLPAAVGGFLLQHSLQGWCPPVPILRRLGFRTRSEIDREKYALKALRGDFGEIPHKGRNGSGKIRRALAAVER